MNGLQWTTEITDTTVPSEDLLSISSIFAKKGVFVEAVD